MHTSNEAVSFDWWAAVGCQARKSVALFIDERERRPVSSIGISHFRKRSFKQQGLTRSCPRLNHSAATAANTHKPILGKKPNGLASRDTSYFKLTHQVLELGQMLAWLPYAFVYALTQ
jgi:hypothetical protein